MNTGITHLIINSPYREPAKFWRYKRESKQFTLAEGRRPAGYVMATPGLRSFDDPGVFVEIELVNRIRPRLKTWREAGYPGVTGTTKRLLEHWNDKQQRDESHQFFFCTLEAIETLIWLRESAESERTGIEIPSDGGAFNRLCCKLATGGGKTTVMAMLIAWHILNKVAYPQDARFTKNVFVIAPGLTVKSRLQVLDPLRVENYYDEFNIVPDALREILRQGRVLIHNWHVLNWETDTQIKKRRSVDKRGAKSDEAYVREVLGPLANATNILVINDEAHHAWRVNPESKKAKIDRQLIEEATKWVGGLDRIDRARKILCCYDYSATPFAPSGKQSTEEALFPWVVSDFGLNDAIESGLVKTPRIVVRDDALPDARTYKSKLYHIYMDPDVRDDLNRPAQESEPLPDLVTNAYYLLGKDWLETKTRWEKEKSKIPPVMITVANRTETAARIKNAFDKGKILIEELSDASKTLHIDSKVLSEAESRDEEEEDTPLDDQNGENGAAKLTKKQQAELLRKKVDTVGRVGQPGEQIQNVISVGMLSEGWDAKTVTHIMGLRAFSSQLLCEQVIGRGLRRTSYETGKDDLFEPEYVNVFGVPFSFLPHEGDERPRPPTPPKTRIEALKDREAEFAISWPNIIRIDRAYKRKLVLDLKTIEPLQVNAADTTQLAELAPVVSGQPDFSKISEIDLQRLAERFRMQKIVFEAARDIYDRISPSWQGGKEDLLAQLIRLVESFIASGKIDIEPPLFYQDDLKRRLMLTLNMSKIVQHVFSKIVQDSSEALVPVFNQDKPIRSTSEMLPWYSGRPCEPTRKSHINLVVLDSTWESSDAFHLERNEQVQSWVKNDHLGFDIIYIFKGVVHKYWPDFLIRLQSGGHLMLEVKGENDAQAKAKYAALEEWVQAVNQHGGFGTWKSAISISTTDIGEQIGKAVGATNSSTSSSTSSPS
ncbi:MAG: BPTD_3080 family restriction endonuclease [Chthoniobacterales bacterium]